MYRQGDEEAERNGVCVWGRERGSLKEREVFEERERECVCVCE